MPRESIARLVRDEGVAGSNPATPTICQTLPRLRGADRPIEVRSTSTVAAALVVLAHLLIALATAWHAPFRTEFDGLQHLSVIRAQQEAPSLFPDHRAERILSLPSLAAWTDKPNYIPHPPLYYLALAPLSGGPAPSVLTLRLANAAMSAVALCLVLLAGWRLFPTEAGRVVFALMAAAFPKAAVIGGMINNDNLAMLAAALVFAGLAGAPGGVVLLAAGLALAGWSKLTAMVALGAVTLAWLWIEGRARDAAWARNCAIARERDDFSSSRHPALHSLLEHDLFRKPVATFRDHACAGSDAASLHAGARNGFVGAAT